MTPTKTMPHDSLFHYREFDRLLRICREHLSGCPGGTPLLDIGGRDRDEEQQAATERMRYLALAMAGEAGEAANIVKKQWRGDLNVNESLLIKEAADTAVYAWTLLSHLGVDPVNEMLRVLDDYEKRPKLSTPLRPHTEETTDDKLREVVRLLNEIITG